MAWNSNRQQTPYFVSTIATGIYRDEFDSDTGYQSLSAISGWLENNVGLLNTEIYTSFSGSGMIDGANSGDTALVPTGGFKFEEAEIFKQVYLVEYYKKKTRTVLKNIDSSVDFITLRDGDSMITRTNKNEIAKTYRGLANDAQERLQLLTAKYNIYGATPLQVAGTDAPAGPTGTAANYVYWP
jgi:hypothetical protein|tara:strand:+ start:1014 stop:1565 length:552 start_codon:yes stop_codon:yes gene_type:complete